MTKLTVDLKFGVSNKGAGYDSSGNKAAADFEKKLRAAVVKAEKAIVASDIPDLQRAIIDNVERDLAKFARQVVTYFMSQRFSLRGSPRAITAGGLDDGKPFNSSIWGGASPPKTSHLMWAPLADSTIKRKVTRPGGASTYYFVWTGELKEQIRGAFGDLLGELINPSITFTTTGGADFTRGNKLGSVKVRLFRSANEAGMFRSAFSSGDWSQATNDGTLLHRYMAASIADKLGNSRNSEYSPTRARGRAIAEGNARPWVGPSVAYWIIMRMPNIVINSINETVKNHKGTRGASSLSSQFEGF